MPDPPHSGDFRRTREKNVSYGIPVCSGVRGSCSGVLGPGYASHCQSTRVHSKAEIPEPSGKKTFRNKARPAHGQALPCSAPGAVALVSRGRPPRRTTTVRWPVRSHGLPSGRPRGPAPSVSVPSPPAAVSSLRRAPAGGADRPPALCVHPTRRATNTGSDPVCLRAALAVHVGVDMLGSRDPACLQGGKLENIDAANAVF